MTNLELTIKSLRNKFLTIDCNVFLLLVVGNIGLDNIEKFKRTNIFQKEDYPLLIKLIEGSKLILTPNVLTEASNLLESYNKQIDNLAFLSLKKLIELNEESYLSSIQLSNSYCYLKFGLTDSSLFELSEKGVVTLTTDFPLFGLLQSRGLPAINFNQVRSERILNG